MDVMVDTSNQKVYTIGHVQPKSSHSIPLQFASRGAIRFRPSAIVIDKEPTPKELFHWSEEDLR